MPGIRSIACSLILVAPIACKPSAKTLEPIEEVTPETPRELNSSFGIKAEVEGLPEGQSRQTKIVARVSGDSLVSYSYKIGPLVTTECELAFDYTRKLISNPIEVDIESLPDGEIAVCIVGEDSKGNWQPYDLATKVVWTKLTGALAAPEEVTGMPGTCLM